MKQKMTISELRSFIQQQALNLLAEHIIAEKKLQEDNSALKRDLEMRMNPSSGNLSLSDLEDVASEHGLNLDNDELLAISQALMSSHASERDSELKDDIQYTLDSHFNGETPETFQDFYNIFSQLNFDNTYTPQEVKEKFNTLTTNPNQLSLFESLLKKALLENNIYRNKYNIETVSDPIIPDVVKILSNNPKAIKVNNKAQFEDLANEQVYFSPSRSHCFYSEEEMNNWRSDNTKISPEAEESVLVFETGREPVQIWDEKNKIGFIIPKNKDL